MSYRFRNTPMKVSVMPQKLLRIFLRYCRVERNKLSANNKTFLNPFNPTKWSNTLKQFVAKADHLFSVFDHFVGLALKGNESE